MAFSLEQMRNAMSKLAAEKEDGKSKAESRANELLDTSSWSSFFNDVLTPNTWGATRAGRATQLDRALGRDPSVLLQYPRTTNTVGTLAGLLAGGGLGASLSSGQSQQAQLLGTIGGAAAGGLLGRIGLPLYRRLLLEKTRKELAAQLAGGKEEQIIARNKEQKPALDHVSATYLPLGGYHQAGQADAYEALRDSSAYPKDLSNRDMAYMANTVFNNPMLDRHVGAMMGHTAVSRVQ